LAWIGQRQTPRTARKKPLSKDFFELTYLCADRWLGDVQLFARAPQTPFLRHRPEIKEMMIIQPIHCSLGNSEE
jgi:hypothetical protein